MTNVVITFDGGSKGNPGMGYGSFRVVYGDLTINDRNVEYGDNMTNNEAEFTALIEALTATIHAIREPNSEITLTIQGDSKLVIHGVDGTWKIKEPRLLPLLERINVLLLPYREVTLRWVPRRTIYRMFGH